MTTLEKVTQELKNKNIPTTGVYSSIPKNTFMLVRSILFFGKEKALSASGLGFKVKDLAVQLAEKDGRKPILCDITGKYILV